MKILSRLFNLKESRKTEDSWRIDQRLRDLCIENIKFIYEDKSYDVANVSQFGLGVHFDGEQKPPFFKPQSCKVRFYEEECEAKVEFVHLTNGILGVSIGANQTEFNQCLRCYFESELQGLQVRKMDPSKLKSRKEGTPNWYYSDPQHELFFLTKDEKVIFFQLNYQGCIIEMNLQGNVSFGEVNEHFKNRIKGSDLIVDTDLKSPLISMAIRFLGQIKELSQEHYIFIKKKVESALLSK